MESPRSRCAAPRGGVRPEASGLRCTRRKRVDIGSSATHERAASANYFHGTAGMMAPCAAAKT